MGEIRERAGASTGSVYHHFQSKEELAGALYLEGIRVVQEEGLAELVKHRTAERGVRALVLRYLDWVRDNPMMAAYLFNHRHAEFMASSGRRMDQMNLRLRTEVSGWLNRHVEAGDLPAVSMEMFWAVLVGPSEFICRRRLREGRPEEIANFARELADATWGALSGILAGQRGSRRAGRPRG
jgi:AcrR family transcriptional regulator